MDSSSGDQAWMLASTALVQVMTPGLAFFYVSIWIGAFVKALPSPFRQSQSGLVGEDSVLSTMMLSVGSMGVVTVLWYLIGVRCGI